MDVSRSLQMQSGFEVVQNGQPGGTTALFVRGGYLDPTKVLLDRIPINDIGGAVEFANLATVGMDRVEVLRGPNSVLYGSDGLAGVVTLSSRRGATTTPALRILVPYAGTMRRYPVSTRVNQVQNDDAECAKPIELEPTPQGQLFA